MYMFEELPAAATATTRSWGAFSLSAVPRTGETVVLDDAEYVVESRRWTPKRVGSKVDRDSPMWRHQLEAAAAGPARGHCLVGDAGRAPRIWQRLPGPSSSPRRVRRRTVPRSGSCSLGCRTSTTCRGRARPLSLVLVPHPPGNRSRPQYRHPLFRHPLYRHPLSRNRNPLALAAGRSMAARSSASVPTSRTNFSALVRAV